MGNSDGVTPYGSVEYRWGIFRDFRPMETIDWAVITVER